MYTESKCGVKINTKRTRYLSQEHGVRQGCCLSQHYLTSILMNWRSVWSDLQPLASLYTTHRSDACCMQMIWFCCLPPNMVYSRTWTCWSNTARPGPWQSTWRKPTLWSFRKDPDPREQHIFTLGTNQKHTHHTTTTWVWKSHPLETLIMLWMNWEIKHAGPSTP